MDFLFCEEVDGFLIKNLTKFDFSNIFDDIFGPVPVLIDPHLELLKIQFRLENEVLRRHGQKITCD